MASSSSSASVNDLNKVMLINQEHRYPQYRALIDNYIKFKDIQAIISIATHLVAKEGADPFGRTYITPKLLDDIIRQLLDTSNTNPIPIEQLISLGEALVGLLRPRSDDYADALINAVDMLAQAYSADDQNRAAAHTYSSIRFEDLRSASVLAERQLEWWVNCTECWLEEEETGHAKQSLKNAQIVVKNAKNASHKLKTRYKVVCARVLDFERKFLEAAQSYIDLSLTANDYSDDELLQALEYAVTCTILSKAGPNRSRVLLTLYSDPRSRKLWNFELLEKVYRERIIRPDEVHNFEQKLAPHQNATTSSGMTVLQHSINEHNITAIAKLFVNIRLSELALLLGTNAARAESIACSMIEQKRLNAQIDQVDGFLEFSSGMVRAENKPQVLAGTQGTLGEWNQSIFSLCVLINSTAEKVAQLQHA